MASNVFANSLAVATSTTGHVAHVLPPGDIRLVPPTPTPTPFFNKVDSSKIYAGAPVKTKFQSGKIWVEGTLAGPTSEPMITFPGQISGGVSEWATSKEGSGSKNVFVESRKVFCFTHQTWQNRRNSQGMINDAAGAAKAEAEFEEEQAKNRKLIAPGAGAGSEGDADADDGKPAETETPPEEPTEAPPPEEKCEVTTVWMTDQHTDNVRGRNAPSRTRNQNVAKDKKDAKIEVVGTSEITFEAAFGTAICGDHEAQWSGPGNWTASGPKVTYKTNPITLSGALQGAALGAIGGPIGSMLGAAAGSGAAGHGSTSTSGGVTTLANALRLAFVTPRQHTIKCSTCTEEFTRQVYAFPNSKADAKLEIPALKEWGLRSRANIVRLFGTDRGNLSVISGEFSVAAGWKEQRDWRCFYEVEIGGSVVLVKGWVSFKKSFFNLPIPIPPAEAVKRVIQAINWVYRQLTGGDLIDIYLELKIEAEITTGLTVTGTKEYLGGWSWRGREVNGEWGSSAKVSVGGKIKITLSVGIAALTTAPNPQTGESDALARAEGFASFDASIQGSVPFQTPVNVEAELKYGPVKLGIKLSYNLLVLFPGEVNANDGNWFYRQYAWVRNRGSQLTRAAAEKALKSMADMSLKGDMEWSFNALEERTVKLR